MPMHRKRYDYLECTPEKDVHLDALLDAVKKEYFHIFNSIFNCEEMETLKSVSIVWCNWYDFEKESREALVGERSFYVAYYYDERNLIEMNSYLKGARETALKCQIFHEILHIHFQDHKGDFYATMSRFSENFDDYAEELSNHIDDRVVEEMDKRRKERTK
jgi:hypothetical protein